MSKPTKLVVDCATGKTTVVPLTEEEIATLERLSEEDIGEEHLTDDPVAEVVARLVAENRVLIAKLEAGERITAEAVRAEAAETKGDDSLVLALAKELSAPVEEVIKKRESDPDWFAKMVEKYNLSPKKEK